MFESTKIMTITARNKMTDIEETGTTVYNQAIKIPLFGNELYVNKIVRIERIAKQ